MADALRAVSGSPLVTIRGSSVTREALLGRSVACFVEVELGIGRPRLLYCVYVNDSIAPRHVPDELESGDQHHVHCRTTCKAYVAPYRTVDRWSRTSKNPKVRILCVLADRRGFTCGYRPLVCLTTQQPTGQQRMLGNYEK